MLLTTTTRVTRSRAAATAAAMTRPLGSNNKKKGSNISTASTRNKEAKGKKAIISTAMRPLTNSFKVGKETHAAGTVKTRKFKEKLVAAAEEELEAAAAAAAGNTTKRGGHRPSQSETVQDTTASLPPSAVLPPPTIPPNLAPKDVVALGISQILQTSPVLATYLPPILPDIFNSILTAHTSHPPPPSPTDPESAETLKNYYFRSLARGIIAQQVSGAAAASIMKKFQALFTPKSHVDGDIWEEKQLGLVFPTPKQVAETPQDVLRTAGLSERKAQYMHSLAEFFINPPLLSSATAATKGKKVAKPAAEIPADSTDNASDERVDIATFPSLPDETIINLVTSVKGIGRWSAEMFLLFAMGRWDVFSTGDLGIQRGMSVWATLERRHAATVSATTTTTTISSTVTVEQANGNVKKKSQTAKTTTTTTKNSKWKYMSEDEMMRLSERFKPFRSLLCLVLWRVGDTKIDALDESKLKKGKRKNAEAEVEGADEKEDEEVKVAVAPGDDESNDGNGGDEGEEENGKLVRKEKVVRKTVVKVEQKRAVRGRRGGRKQKGEKQEDGEDSKMELE